MASRPRLPALVLNKEPDVYEALGVVCRHGLEPTLDVRQAFDTFSRLFCTSCGRHTYGDLRVSEFPAQEAFALCVSRRYHSPLSSWYNTYKNILERQQHNHDKHVGRTSPVCVDCECIVQTDLVSATPLGHHRVLDLTRPLDSGDESLPDQYMLPADKPLWQERPAYCRRMIDFWYNETSHWLLERTDGLWIYLHTYDCPATPNYRCHNTTCIYWSESWATIWHTYMTQGARRALWTLVTRGHMAVMDVGAVTYFGINENLAARGERQDKEEEDEDDKEEK